MSVASSWTDEGESELCRGRLTCETVSETLGNVTVKAYQRLDILHDEGPLPTRRQFRDDHSGISWTHAQSACLQDR